VRIKTSAGLAGEAQHGQCGMGGVTVVLDATH
jgi:hypothetical protein